MELSMVGLLTMTGIILGGLGLLVAVTLRRVVPTNEVHIVQSSKRTTSYGKDTGNGNTYYQWPSFIPILGVTRVVLPMSVFDLDLEGYEAFDKGRLPFQVDVKAFFQISDSNVAAQRVASFSELNSQLLSIVQGAVRVVLASNDIEEILNGRSTFGEQFTKEVAENLKSWGVTPVKNIELMDIRDGTNSNSIRSIMEKKKSLIDMESRTEVAKNRRAAEIAEIEAKREVDMQQQNAAQTVGLRTIETQRELDLQNQARIQMVKEQERTTKEKEMNVLRVQEVTKAEIERNVNQIRADQNKQVQIINAEAELETARRTAEANLELKKRESEGITLEGEARASAEKALQLAPVQAQIALAQEIGENQSYQKYLVTIRQIEADQEVGKAQAAALEKADVKVISNTGAPSAGVKNVMDLFSSKGGTELGSMLEAFGQTEVGGKLINGLTSRPSGSNGHAN